MWSLEVSFLIIYIMNVRLTDWAKDQAIAYITENRAKRALEAAAK
jgi:adenosylcobinamide amidohydrolase